METLPNLSNDVKTLPVNRISLDWLSFTSHDPSYNRNPELVGDFLGMTGRRTSAGGLFGYKKSYYQGLVRVLYSGTDTMGVHVIISGEALRVHFPEPFDLIKKLHLSGQVKFSRIDIAFDDFTGSLSIPRLVQTLRSGHVVASSRSWSCLENGTIGNEASELTGEGVMVGKRDSESCIRFYNKTLQQKTLENSESLAIPDVWVRMELELKRDKSNDFISKWVDDYGSLDQLFMDVINGLVRFVEPSDNDTNKRRWSMFKWWSDIITSKFPCKLSSPEVIPCIVKTVKWFQRNCASTLVLLYKVCGTEYFDKLIYAHDFDHSAEKIKLLKQIYSSYVNEKFYQSQEVAGFDS